MYTYLHLELFNSNALIFLCMINLLHSYILKAKPYEWKTKCYGFQWVGMVITIRESLPKNHGTSKHYSLEEFFEFRASMSSLFYYTLDSLHIGFLNQIPIFKTKNDTSFTVSSTSNHVVYLLPITNESLYFPARWNSYHSYDLVLKGFSHDKKSLAFGFF